VVDGLALVLDGASVPAGMSACCGGDAAWYVRQLAALGSCQPPCQSPSSIPRHAWRTLPTAGRQHHRRQEPLQGGQSPAKPRATGPPWGSGAAAPQGALRAIDSFVAAAFLGGPAVRAACGGNLSRAWLPL
jgi:hypothetical protein